MITQKRLLKHIIFNVYTKNPACPHGLQGYPKNNLT
nr:MAG TPA: hypothetical protein [Caudoviricetes sp.]